MPEPDRIRLLLCGLEPARLLFHHLRLDPDARGDDRAARRGGRKREAVDAERAERRALDREIDDLRRQRDRLDKTQAAERAKLAAARDRGEAAYERALKRWRG